MHQATQDLISEAQARIARLLLVKHKLRDNQLLFVEQLDAKLKRYVQDSQPVNLNLTGCESWTKSTPPTNVRGNCFRLATRRWRHCQQAFDDARPALLRASSFSQRHPTRG